MGIEKDAVGIEVNHSLKSLCIPSFSPSTISYSSGIQLIDKWQFCSNTQNPFEVDNSTKAFAFFPCPWPSEIDLYLSDMFAY